jgi:hypothetical protein
MNKYGAKRVEIDGYVFASKKEAARYIDLKSLQRAGEIKDLELQVPFAFEYNDVRICRYTADFTYKERKNGHWVEIVEDVKGKATRDYRLRKRLMLAFYGISVRET